MFSHIVFLLPVFIIAFFTTMLLTPIVKKIAIRKNILDTPSERKMHKKPIPHLGGIAIYAGFIVSLLFSVTVLKIPLSPLFGILIGSSIIVVLGLLDDIFSLKPTYKLLGQIFAAFATYSCGISINFITHPAGGIAYLDLLSLPLTIIWIVGIINTINLIDGSDGLAAGVSAISACVLTFVAFRMGQIPAAVLAIIIFGNCLGFLRYNFSPAQIFMGDTGSMFLGYLLATISIIGVLKTTITLSLVVPLLVLGIPILDTAFTIIRRMKNKQAIFKPDKGHFHHRLLNLGLSHKQVAIYIYICSILLGSFAIWISTLSGIQAYIALSFTIFTIATLSILIHKKKHKIKAALSLFL
jgi:UDP-GlcNAc:undecaprenyl-phosphate/decaprenyl-phosphate GlcNAc-1-phosphate transferase